MPWTLEDGGGRGEARGERAGNLVRGHGALEVCRKKVFSGSGGLMLVFGQENDRVDGYSFRMGGVALWAKRPEHTFKGGGLHSL